MSENHALSYRLSDGASFDILFLFMKAIDIIIHCTLRLARILRNVSIPAIPETSPLGSWTANLYTIDRRQCVLFCHDESRYVLFEPGLRKEHFEDLGLLHHQLLLGSLARLSLQEQQLKKVALELGPKQFDRFTNRSVLGSMNIAHSDLDCALAKVTNVMALDLTEVALYLNHRPAKVRGVWLWPDKVMTEHIDRI